MVIKTIYLRRYMRMGSTDLGYGSTLGYGPRVGDISEYEIWI